MGDTPTRSDIAVEGMTCAACANRIQRTLTKLDGVSDARVNFANGRATVIHDAAVLDDQLRAAIERLGYEAPVTADHDEAEQRREADLRRRWIVAVVLGLPVVAISMVPPLMFDGWQWAAAILATPVVFWCGWGFHRAAWMNLRHGTTTMDTLVSMGTSLPSTRRALCTPRSASARSASPERRFALISSHLPMRIRAMITVAVS